MKHIETLTKRELYAGMAMQGLLSRLSTIGGDFIVGPHIPRLAVEQADALIATLASVPCESTSAGANEGKS